MKKNILLHIEMKHDFDAYRSDEDSHVFTKDDIEAATLPANVHVYAEIDENDIRQGMRNPFGLSL